MFNLLFKCRAQGAFTEEEKTNTGVGPGDFTPFTLFSPIDGAPITYYNVSAAKVAQLGTNLVDTNAPDRSDKYNGFEYSFTARLFGKVNLFGDASGDRVARGITFSDNGAAVTFDDCPREHAGCRAGMVGIR